VSGALAELGPADRHRVVAARFAAVTRSIADWDGPSPVPEWTAREVVGHLVWFRGLLHGGAAIDLPAGPAVDADPVAAWASQAASVQALLDDPATAGRVLSNPHIGDVPLPEAVDRFYTTDVFLHTWDLGRAAGVDPELDEEYAVHVLDGMRSVEAMLRGSGQYGPAKPVAADAPVQDQLAAFIGRDPSWRAAGS